MSPADATGTVQFLNGEDQLCEGTIVDGKATCIVQTPPPPGEHAITAVYEVTTATSGRRRRSS